MDLVFDLLVFLEAPGFLFRIMGHDFMGDRVLPRHFQFVASEFFPPIEPGLRLQEIR